MVTRRELLGRGAGVAVALGAAPLIAACAPAAPPVASSPTPAPTPTPLPPPETTTIRLTCVVCDAPIMAAERFLREEGFTDVQIIDVPSGRASVQAITSGKADLGPAFPTELAAAAQLGTPIVGLAGIHPGCSEIWAPQTVGSLKDLRGRTVVVRSASADELGYVFPVMALKHAGIDAKEVNFVVNAAADPTKLYLEGKNDAVFAGATTASALRANPANKGRTVWEQTMDRPWSALPCCVLSASAEWYRANPIAAKRAVRAILRAADQLPADRTDAVKAMTDKGLFGGPSNFVNARGAANMVPLAWRELDPAESFRFHAQLLSETGLRTVRPDDAAKVLDLRILEELRKELRR